MISSEWDLIGRIKSVISGTQKSPPLIQGIGDDCAVYEISTNRFDLFSIDAYVDEVHFRKTYATPYQIGFKSMASNVSDIYAMGGRPVLALISAGIPRDFDSSYIEEIYQGMAECANTHSTFIAGGDTTSSDRFFLSISIYGETDNPVMRSGAQTGDYIYVTGQPGYSQAGLEILNGRGNVSDYPLSVKKHLTPEPPSGLLPVILKDFNPSSMIDISDGLISDLDHICSQSKRGFEVDAGSLPAGPELLRYAESRKKNVIEYILTSGEEYELLFTSHKKLDSHENISLIGRITAGGKKITSRGTPLTLNLSGYNHFKKDAE